MDDGRHPNYSEDGFTAFIPFTNEPSNCFTKDVRLRVQIPRYHGYQGPYKRMYEHTPPMDTGSTGIAISAFDLGYTDELQLQQYEKGTEYLSSSRVYYEGYWVPTRITFPDGNVSANIEILAVTFSGICTKFNHVSGVCEELSKENPSGRFGRFPKKVFYLGVGFGRLSTEQPGGTADRNPLLNIMSDGTMNSGNIHQGYVITEKGVWVGLNKNNASEISLIKLSPALETQSVATLREWNGTPAFLSYHDHLNMQGSVLFDTGVSQSYLSGPAFQSNNLKALAPGDKYTIKIGENANKPLEILEITVGDVADPTTPSYVKAKRREAAFVNTGRFFYREFDLLFDAERGWVGLRKHAVCNPSSSSSL